MDWPKLIHGPIFGTADRRAGSLHFIDRSARVAAFQINPAHGVFQHDDCEAFFQAIENGLLDAIVGGETADHEPLDAARARQVRQPNTVRVNGIETGITIGVFLHSLGDDNGTLVESEIGMELGPMSALDAVRRPDPTVGIEMSRPSGMPIARRDYRQPGLLKPGDQAIEDRDDLIASSHGQCAAGAEIVLHIDDYQRFLCHRKSL